MTVRTFVANFDDVRRSLVDVVHILRGVFLSSEQTGNGSAQSVAHGLQEIPSLVFAIPSNLTGGAYVVTYGTHTATNCVLTVTNNEKYRVVALLLGTA